MKKPHKTMTAKEDMLLYHLHMEGKNRHEIFMELRRGYDLIKDSYKRQGLTPIMPPKKRYLTNKTIIRDRVELTAAQKLGIAPIPRVVVKLKPIDYKNGEINAVSQAMLALGSRAEFKRDAYYLDGKLVTVLHILEAANKLLSTYGMPLIGFKHSQWRQ